MPGFAIRYPFFIIMLCLIIAVVGVTTVARMPVDLFPNINIPVVVVATFYSGMPPEQIEANITNPFERFFTLGSGIDHIESRSLTGVSLIKIYFQPGTDPDAAVSGISNLAMAQLRRLPPGTLPPVVLKFDASSLPVCLITLKGHGLNETELHDLGQFTVRNQIANVPGASVPQPFGGKYRQIQVYVDPIKLQAHQLSLMDVVRTVNGANTILPAGDVRIGPKDYNIYTNSQLPTTAAMDRLPLKSEGNAELMIGDVGHAEDGAAIQTNIVRVDGQKSVYLPILKQGGNSNTIAIVDGIKKAVGDLLVQASLEAVLGPVAEHAQRVVHHRGPVLRVTGVVGLRQVERLTPGAPRQRAQQLCVLAHEHLVGVEVQQPVSARCIERHVARLRERACPRVLDNARSDRPRQLDRRIGRARVDDHDLIDRAGDRRQAAREHLLLVAHDHAQAQTQPLCGPGARGDLQGLARELGQRRAQRRAADGATLQAPSHGKLGEVVLHVLELRVQALSGHEQRFSGVQTPQLLQDDAGVVEQPRLAGLALEHAQGARGERNEQRRLACGRGAPTRPQPPLDQADAHPVATVRVRDRLDLLEQLAVAVEVVDGQQLLGARRQIGCRHGAVARG